MYKVNVICTSVDCMYNEYSECLRDSIELIVGECYDCTPEDEDEEDD